MWPIGETPQNPRRDPAEPSERPPQSPLRGTFPRRASQRVAPLGWWPSGTLEQFSEPNSPNSQSNRLKALLSKGNLPVRVRFGAVLSTIEEVVPVRFCCSLSWKTNTGNTGRTVLGHCPTSPFWSSVCNSDFWWAVSSGRVQPRQGTEICKFRHRLHWIFWIFLQRIYFCFSRLSVWSSKEIVLCSRPSHKFVKDILRCLGRQQYQNSWGTALKSLMATYSDELATNSD